jgi:membrane-bound lytic murein transglycosylase B
MNPLEPTGSYAGAMGMPQFISSSFRNLAYDFDKDGKRDIWKNKHDVIGSVANYFHHHRWHSGEPIAIKTALKELDSEIPHTGRKARKPELSMLKLKAFGIKTPDILNQNDLAAIIQLKQKKGADYWLGFNNFYVITRYNHSNLYAMAVFQLSEKIKALMDKK